MKVTASINFENKKAWNGLRKHLEHDRKLDHQNKFLNTEESKQRRKLNQWIKFYDFDDLIKDKFSDYIATQNKKNMDKGRLERCWHSIHDFETKSSSGTARTKTLDKLAVFTFSNEDDFDNKIFKPMVKAYASKYPNKSDQEIDDKIRGCISHGLIRYTKGFNKRNPNLIMIEGVTHMDEKGSPHVHARVLPYVPSKIKNGKPKWSVNNALRQQFGHHDTRENMKDFRDKEDREILQAINKQIQIELPEIAKDYQFDLVRLHPAVKGLEHDEYKAIKQREDIKKNNQRLAEQQNKLNSLKKQIKDATADLKDQQDKIKEIEQKQAERAKKLDKRENKLNDRELELDARTAKINKREKNVAQQEQQVNDRARDNANLLIMLNNQLNSIRQLKHSIKHQLDKWKSFASSVAIKTFLETENFVVDNMPKSQQKKARDWLDKSDASKHAQFINRNAYLFPDNLGLTDIANPAHFFDDYNKVEKNQKSSDQAFNKQIDKTTKQAHDSAKYLKKQYKSVLTPEQLAKLDSLVDDSNEKDDGIDY